MVKDSGLLEFGSSLEPTTAEVKSLLMRAQRQALGSGSCCYANNCMRGKWALFGVLVVAAGGAGAAYSLLHRKVEPRPSTPGTPVQPPAITVTGKIRAAHITGVGAQVSGNIDTFLVDVGQEVYAGQNLAEVGGVTLESDRTDAEVALEKAQNRAQDEEKAVAAAQLEASRANADAQRAREELERVQKVYDRQKLLFAQGATPRLTYEKAVRDYESAQEQWAAIDKAARGAGARVTDTIRALDNARQIVTGKTRELYEAQNAAEASAVQSPVDGLVVGRKGAVGDPAQPLGEELFQIATDLFDLEVVVEPKPEILARLHAGQPALVMVPDLQASGMEGAVKEVSGKEHQAVISFKNPNPAIRPGMVAEVRLLLDAVK